VIRILADSLKRGMRLTAAKLTGESNAPVCRFLKAQSGAKIVPESLNVSKPNENDESKKN
jgi:hypothetical protein